MQAVEETRSALAGSNAGRGRSARLCLTILSGLAASFVPATGQPAPATARRAPVDIGSYPWSSIGKLFNSIGGACTAVAVAPDRVLTAAHCLYAFRTHRFLPPDAIHVLLGYDRGDFRVHARVARYGIGPGYDPERERDTAAADWAVLTLTQPLEGDIRPVPLAARPPDAGTRIVMGGFAQDRAFKMTADTACAVTGAADDGRLILHDCRIEHGDSGAPLLEPAGPGDYRCFAIAIGLSKPSRGGAALGLAAPVDAAMLARAAPPPDRRAPSRG